MTSISNIKLRMAQASFEKRSDANQDGAERLDENEERREELEENLKAQQARARDLQEEIQQKGKADFPVQFWRFLTGNPLDELNVQSKRLVADQKLTSGKLELLREKQKDEFSKIQGAEKGLKSTLDAIEDINAGLKEPTANLA